MLQRLANAIKNEHLPYADELDKEGNYLWIGSKDGVLTFYVDAHQNLICRIEYMPGFHRKFAVSERFALKMYKYRIEGRTSVKTHRRRNP